MTNKKDNSLRNGIVLLLLTNLITNCLTFGYQQNKIHQIQQQEKLFEKQQELFVNAFVMPSKMYSAIWGMWYAVQENASQNEREKRAEKLQSFFDEANIIGVELSLNFKNQNIYKDWDNFMQKYHHAQYPITREGITEKELNKRLHEADVYIENMQKNMYLEIKQRKK